MNALIFKPTLSQILEQPFFPSIKKIKLLKKPLFVICICLIILLNFNYDILTISIFKCVVFVSVYVIFF